MKPLKTNELRPCDNCGGSIIPFFYRLRIEFRQLGIDRHAVNQVLGTAQMLGGNLFLGSMMSPNQDATFELPCYQVDKDIILCQDCVIGMTREPFVIRPLDWMIEPENEEADDEL